MRFPSQAYTTFSMHSPIETHFRKATCAEVNCYAYLNGWALQIEDLSDGDFYVATHAGKRYQKVHFGPGVNFLMFEAGQPCFEAASHRIALQRPEWFFRGRGDRRIFSTRTAHRYDRGDQWAYDLATRIDRLNAERQRG